MKVTITFELAEGSNYTADQLHEDLCKTIHEQDDERLFQMCLNVTNIVHPDHNVD